MLRLARFDGSADDHGHLAHEVYHAVDFLMRRIGIKPDCDEAYAYAIANLTTRIHESIRKMR